MSAAHSLQGFYQIAERIWEQLPPPTRFRPEDGQALHQFRALLLQWEDPIISGFYDTLFGHGMTKAVFREGERPMREQSLRLWFHRTIEGPFNSRYFAWQTLVGLVHLRRNVSNAQVIVMWGWMTEQIRLLSHQALAPAQANQLTIAWSRLASTVSALIVEGQLQTYIQSLSEQLGQDRKLLQAAAMSWLEELEDQREIN